MYSFLPEHLLNTFFLIFDFAGDLIVDFDVTGWTEVDDLVGVIDVVWVQGVGSFYLCIWELGVSFFPDIIIIGGLVLRGELVGLSSLLVFTLFEEILIHWNEFDIFDWFKKLKNSIYWF